MGTIVRGKIIRDDASLFDGKNTTASRVDASGGTVTGLRLNDFVDVLQVFGSGSNRNVAAIDTAVSFIGTGNDRTLMFSPGTWTIDSDLTIPSNFTVYVAAGAVFNVSASKTLTIAGPVIHEALTWTSGSGTVTVSQGGAESIELKDTSANYTATNVEDALAELASTANGEGASIIGLEDSGGNYTATDVEAALAELASTASGEGASIIGIQDSAGNFTATDVEAALAEIFTTLDTPGDVRVLADTTPQELSGAGAVNLTTYCTHIVSTGANALTLADGTEGQFKFLVMKTDAGDATLTPTSLGNGTTITFDVNAAGHGWFYEKHEGRRTKAKTDGRR